VTTPPREPGDRRPQPDRPQPDRAQPDRPQLDRPPGDRYVTRTPAPDAPAGRLDALLVPLGLVLGTGIAFVVLGGILLVTAGLILVAAFAGWLTGRLVSPPARAALVGLAAVTVGLLGIWLFGRLEGGVLDPIAYLAEVEGPIVVVLSLVAGVGLAAAASR
jgi:hypothetical protein